MKIFSIILVIIIAIGGYFVLSKKNNTPATNKTPEVSYDVSATNPKVNGVPVDIGVKMETGTIDTAKKVTVIYTKSGFAPKTISIKKSDSVTFINESGGGMSVASNPHPSHTNYPEFDQYKSSEKGQKSYTFVFEKVGSWGYHDHLNPSNTGAIVVE